MVLLHVRRAKQAKAAFLVDSVKSAWLSVGDRTRNLSLRLKDPVAVQALHLPNENQTRIRTPCTRLAFPAWHFFFKFKFELRGKTVQKKHKWENPCV